MGDFRFCHQLLRGASVSGTVDDTYDPDWLTDGIPGTPVQVAGGGLSLTATPAGSPSCDLFAIVNHTISVNATVGGSASGTIVAGALDDDGIRLNPFLRLGSPVSVGSVSLSASNPDPAIVGEFYGGLSVALEAYELHFDAGDPFPWEGEFTSIAPYDPGLSYQRRLYGEVVLDDAGYALIQHWYAATRRGTRPSLVIPDDAINDAWACLFRYQRRYEETVHFVTLEILEIPRTRW